MPSKGGSRAATGAQSLTDVLASVIRSSGAQRDASQPATGGELAEVPGDRPLQRGIEVERFNDLAARRDALTPEESAELLGYRVRRVLSTGRELDRLAHSWDENLVGRTLERYRHRIDRMRELESLIERDGQPFEIDPAIQDRALSRLALLSAQRPHGLIAGEGDAPQMQPGSERVGDLAFNPSPQDVALYVLTPSSIPSEALAANVAALREAGAQISVVHDQTEIPRGEIPPLVLNWGSNQPLPAGMVVLNSPDSVRIAADQVESLRRLKELAPRTVLNPADIAALGTDLVVAKRRHGARGSGNAIIDRQGFASTAGFDLYQEHLADRREWRVNVLSGRLTSAYRKEPAPGTPAGSLSRSFSYAAQEEVPATVAAVAREASRRLGCDCAGIDVVEDLRTGRVLCLEANTAPGMSQQTLRNLYAHVQQAVRSGLEAAA